MFPGTQIDVYGVAYKNITKKYVPGLRQEAYSVFRPAKNPIYGIIGKTA